MGAGFAGQSIAREIRQKRTGGTIVAFLDDDKEKIGCEIDGIPVLGPIASCAATIEQTKADEAIIAIPTATPTQLRKIYDILHKAAFPRIRILPSAAHIIDGKAHLVQARDIDLQDLLGRTPLKINLKESLEYLAEKRVLITGAGGSIGSELCRQLLYAGAQRLYIFGHGENSIYHIEKELRRLQDEGVGQKATIVPVIGELQNRDYMRFIINRLKTDVIFHCAAHKHVPMMETNPVEAITNNVFGTEYLLQAAEEAGVPRFILISTDKAVNPSCVYGVSKKIAEQLVMSRQKNGRKYMVVRFGNVLGSRGSIIPLLKSQILSGGPVTLTHPDTSRYFMTIPEAVSLILKIGGAGKASGLYLLDMGEPVKIKDIINQMIEFYGYTEEQIPIKIIGLRPGEKIDEKLWSENEIPIQSEFPRIISVRTESPELEKLNSLLEDLLPISFLTSDKYEWFRNRKHLRKRLLQDFPNLGEALNEPEY